ncbi:hypothetical protein [Myxosarcina sp. GI1]|uniref:hypothetical protein n=1 Tax=Myxosarcina sp. GI1 TaxID=1541065 RepID=UPI00056787B0|nr:hypothetical protein [Myxosarcina sp. GI1]
MGEAKRRKKLEPNFGKIPKKVMELADLIRRTKEKGAFVFFFTEDEEIDCQDRGFVNENLFYVGCELHYLRKPDNCWFVLRRQFKNTDFLRQRFIIATSESSDNLYFRRLNLPTLTEELATFMKKRK